MSLIPDKTQKKESKNFTDDTYLYKNKKKKKKSSEDQTSINKENKAGIDELLDSSEFTYKLETKTSKNRLRRVWKNPRAKKEVLAGLNNMNNKQFFQSHKKDFKGFKTFEEIKLNKTRVIIQRGKNGGPLQIVAICMRDDLNNLALKLKFKSKYQ